MNQDYRTVAPINSLEMLGVSDVEYISIPHQHSKPTFTTLPHISNISNTSLVSERHPAKSSPQKKSAKTLISCLPPFATNLYSLMKHWPLGCHSINIYRTWIQTKSFGHQSAWLWLERQLNLIKTYLIWIDISDMPKNPILSNSMSRQKEQYSSRWILIYKWPLSSPSLTSTYPLEFCSNRTALIHPLLNSLKIISLKKWRKI